MGNEKWKLEFVKEMCARFAAGESIDELADSTWSEGWEIVDLFLDNAAGMASASRSIAVSGGAGMAAGMGGVGQIAGALHRLAAAVERIAAARERSSREAADGDQ